MQTKDIFRELKLTIEKQAEQIILLENELLVTNDALQEKDDFANALEQDLEHAIYNLHQINAQKNYMHTFKL